MESTLTALCRLYLWTIQIADCNRSNTRISHSLACVRQLSAHTPLESVHLSDSALLTSPSIMAGHWNRAINHELNSWSSDVIRCCKIKKNLKIQRDIWMRNSLTYVEWTVVKQVVERSRVATACHTAMLGCLWFNLQPSTISDIILLKVLYVNEKVKSKIFFEMTMSF